MGFLLGQAALEKEKEEVYMRQLDQAVYGLNFTWNLEIVFQSSPLVYRQLYDLRSCAFPGFYC
jgi:hypothetical protein